MMVLGPITATFTIHAHLQSLVENGVRGVLARRYLEPRRVRTRSFGERAFLTVEQPGTNEAEATAMLDELRALPGVQSAELECRLERRVPRPRLHLAFEPERIDVV